MVNRFKTVSDDDPKMKSVREFLKRRISRPHIVDYLMSEYGWSHSHSKRFVKTVLERMESERVELQPYDKVRAIESVESAIEDARKKGDIRSVVSAEALLAKIQGTLEPTRLEINVHEERRQALFEYLDSRTDGERQVRLEEFKLIFKKAKFFDQGLSCRDVSPEELGIECKVLKLPIKGE